MVVALRNPKEGDTIDFNRGKKAQDKIPVKFEIEITFPLPTCFRK